MCKREASTTRPGTSRQRKSGSGAHTPGITSILASRASTPDQRSDPIGAQLPARLSSILLLLIACHAAAMVRAPGLMGRSQVVRQRILIPPFGGSSPPAPANDFNRLIRLAYVSN